MPASNASNAPNILLFDLDATLYPHTTGYEHFVIEKILNFMVEELGVPRASVRDEQQRIFVKFGQTLRGLTAPIEQGGLGKEFDRQMYWDYCRGTKAEQAKYLKRDAGVEKLLRALKESGKNKIYLFTNADEKNARVALDCILGDALADELFDGFFGSFFMGDGIAKPAKEAFDKVFEAVGTAVGSEPEACISRRNVVFFEDSATNLKMARVLGLQTVWITGGRHKTLLPGWHGTWSLENGQKVERKLTPDEERRIKEKYPFADHIIDLCDYETVKGIMPALFA